MTVALVAGHGSVGVPSSFHQIRQKRRVQKRHVAAYHQHLVRRCIHQCRVETAQRSGAGDAIGDHAGIPGPNPQSIARDDHDVWGKVAQQRQLPLKDRTRADDERTFVDSAEPPGLSARKDGCCPGNAPIKA